MADLANLRTASLYINNQLLSRGLLRDGEVLDFSDPSRYDGGTGAAMGRIMGIVNDLILRRDRDAEHRESLSTTLRSLRADNLRQTTDLTRLAEKQAETERKLNISEAAEASARAQLKSAEAAVRGLKDEMARMKTLVAQTRASCATEVRRRDRNIDGLKKQLGEATRARGSVRNPAITVISVTGEIGLERGSSGRAADTSDSQYDLRSETNEFLTELAKGLSEENEALSALLRRMREELRAMSGWEREAVEGDEHAVDVTTNVDELEADLNAVLDHMRTILTNPSFVPLEEVVTREEEITRLREGWVKMESRWKEAVQLIDEWRRRMATSGMPVDDKEMDLSLRLSPMRVRDAKEPARVVSLGLACVKEEEEEEEEEEDLEAEVEMEEDYAGAEQPLPAEEHYLADDSVDLVSGPPADNVPASDAESSVFDDPADMEGTDDEEPNVEILQQSAATSQPLQLSVDSSPLPEPPQLSPLKVSSSAGNRRGANEFANPRHKARGYTTTVEEETCELVEETHTQERLVTKRRTQSRPTRTAPSHSKRQKSVKEEASPTANQGCDEAKAIYYLHSDK
ncbi:uncharacterized protein DNG_00895 [Cephalotrichum gorgonifer]|uniref:NIMA interactive protein n=1 Tax=Cephalotrichum gorgonifer TaxID=2041049 RepID=A0AAE8MR28_9PEZI|nr:uncharacterized protein DNG_00895 [Cephalotrichum gorgonifer]